MSTRAQALAYSWRAAPVVLACALLGAFTAAAGLRGATGSAIGVGLVVAFFAAGAIPRGLPSSTPSGTLFGIVMVGYLTRVLAMIVALRLLTGVHVIDSYALGVTVIVGALVWSAMLVHGHLTSRQPTIEIAATRDVAL
jgi:ATP synthase protein I